MTLQRKLMISMVGLAAIPVSITAVALLVQANGGFKKSFDATEAALTRNIEKTREQLVETACDGLANIARDMYATCQAQQELLQQKVNSDLNVAGDQLARAGGVRFDSEMVTWEAVNQLTSEKIRVQLPRMMAGDTWLGQNAQASEPSPLVDEVRQLVGSNCTIFQRMNEAGDMVRVCTNILKTDGTRAIGTYIPAITPDGTPDPVIAKVLKGETYQGRAFVVGQWCVSAYKPLLDDQKKVVGMLFVGVPEQSAESLRQAIMSISIGQSGYVYVLNATGATRGHYVISRNGERDGENLWEVRDSEGRSFIQEACRMALTLQPGQVADLKYPWKNPSDPEPRDKIVKLTYFAPWDWLIGVGAYEDEFYAAVKEMDEQSKAAMDTIRTTQADAGRSVKVSSVIIGLGAAGVASLVALFVTAGISRPLGRAIKGMTEGAKQVNDAASQVSDTSQQLAEGANQQASALEETAAALEEMTTKARESATSASQANERANRARSTSEQGSQTMVQLDQTMAGINEASEKVGKIVKVIEEIAFQTNLLALNAAVEAARAGEHGKGFAVVAEEVRRLALRSAGAVKETTALIEDAVARARQGKEVTAQAAAALQAIAQDVTEVSTLLESINTASQDQAHSVEQVSQAVTSMDKVTQANAAGAEQSAAAAEQLSSQAGAMLAHVAGLAKMIGADKSA
ncbi:MAG TPA: methyl-accepting chemotaxis protein [Phycisphaerae bacterium]|nr:methyl-accepting chemotaxis protein [Phycisphaerae bacterium]HOJ75497.1 methyl-accepting chemotaxis protein [Phycisphaerae bacterium]HOM52867.1 methyl-accepting chemotaxis protein [Phycisphaerae bacterium]HON65611.1 methyl-accepting chemotaxis protein [Phycisphaerae bacterium]HOQ86756.1 methyl-accepting chemotaxis protein [Phycisphaerae bacterium]